jgi:hypothetical protein
MLHFIQWTWPRLEAVSGAAFPQIDLTSAIDIADVALKHGLAHLHMKHRRQGPYVCLHECFIYGTVQEPCAMTVIPCFCTMTSACVDYSLSYSTNAAKLLSHAPCRNESYVWLGVPYVPVSRELHVGDNIIWRPWWGRRGVHILQGMSEAMWMCFSTLTL